MHSHAVICFLTLPPQINHIDYFHMKLYPLFVTGIVFTLLLSSCNWLSTTETEVSSDPSFYSLSFAAANDDDEDVEDAEFDVEIDPITGDSLIINTDSLPYNTAIDSVIPTFSFNSQYATYVYRNDSLGNFKDSVLLTGTDTLNFNRVFKIRNYASDGVTSRVYQIRVNVHKVEPELYKWESIASDIYSENAAIQKALFVNDSIYFFASNGLRSFLYKSADGVNWISKGQVMGLPENAGLKSMTVFNNTIYMFHADSLVYSSTNGVEWSKKVFATNDYWFKNTLYVFKGKLWALVQSINDSKFRFANTTDGENWAMYPSEVPDKFPVAGYGSVVFKSRTNVPKVLLAGGVDQSGEALNTVWSSEDGFLWFNFGKENSTYGYRTGASIIYYEDKLLAFGGLDYNDKMPANLFVQSADEGYSWIAFDTTYMRVRQKFVDPTLLEDSVYYTNYQRRYNQSVVVGNNKFIYLIGGQDSLSVIHKDVWRGRLNKSVFIEQD